MIEQIRFFVVKWFLYTLAVAGIAVITLHLGFGTFKVTAPDFIANFIEMANITRSTTYLLTLFLGLLFASLFPPFKSSR